MSDTWQNRIVGYGTENAEQLLANPDNWRIHPFFQQQALQGLLDQVGWIQNVLVNKRTSEVWGRDRNVETLIDGHLRVALAISKGEKVPVTYVDLNPDEERLVLAALDPLAGLAVTDNEKLKELLDNLKDVPRPAGSAELDQLLNDMLMAIPAMPTGSTSDRHGKHQDEDVWPHISLQVPNEVFERWRALVDDLQGDEWRRFDQVISWAEQFNAIKAKAHV